MPVVNAGVGGSSANSFLTVARAVTLIDEHVSGATFVDSTDSDRQSRAVITASRVLSRLRWKGVASAPTQTLAFPRSGLTARSGYAVDSTTIPLEIELATALLAMMLYDSDVTAQKTQSAEGLQKIKAGPVELQFKNDVVYSDLPPEVSAAFPSEWLVTVKNLPTLSAIG